MQITGRNMTVRRTWCWPRSGLSGLDVDGNVDDKDSAGSGGVTRPLLQRVLQLVERSVRQKLPDGFLVYVAVVMRDAVPRLVLEGGGR